MQRILAAVAPCGLLLALACSDDDGTTPIDDGNGNAGTTGTSGAGNLGGAPGTSGGAGTPGGGGVANTAGQPPVGGAGPVPADCSDATDLTLGEFELDTADFEMGVFARYTAEITAPSLGLVSGDELFIEFTDTRPDLATFTGADTGSFDLSSETDSETCSRCITAIIDGRLSEWFQISGTLVVDAATMPVSGNLSATLTNVLLVPSAGQALQTNDCLSIPTATVAVTGQ